MNTSVSPQDVLSAKRELLGLGLYGDNNLYQMTWGASHVRLTELAQSTNSTLALMVAHALTRHPVGDVALEEWLPNVEFLRGSVESLTKLIHEAISDVAQGYTPNESLSSALTRLLPLNAEFMYEITPGPERKRPCVPFQYGPTSQMFWGVANRFYFLRVHNES
jgi:hypothetical protein